MMKTVGHQGARESPRTALVGAQITVGAFATGILLFVGVTVYLLVSAAGAAPAAPGASGRSHPALPLGLSEGLLSGLLVALLLVVFVAWFAVRGVVVGAARREWAARLDDDRAIERLCRMFRIACVGRAAPVEGLGLLATVLLFLNAAWFMLGPALLSVVLLALCIPTRGQLARFVESATGGSRGGDRVGPHRDERDGATSRAGPA